MRWFLRSAVAAAGLGSVAHVASGQDDPPPPMIPPVRSLPDEEPPASGITKSLIVPAPTVAPEAAFVWPVSPAKPAPAATVQTAIPANPPAAQHGPVRPVPSDEAPTDRPDQLPLAPPLTPPLPLAKVNESDLPLPPTTAKLPSIPIA